MKRCLSSIVLCETHSEDDDGCFCPNPLNRDAQSSSFWLTLVKRDGILEVMNLMSLWPEFVRWRNFMDGPIKCLLTGLEVTTVDLYILHSRYDETAVVEFIRTFDCS